MPAQSRRWRLHPTRPRRQSTAAGPAAELDRAAQTAHPHRRHASSAYPARIVAAPELDRAGPPSPHRRRRPRARLLSLASSPRGIKPHGCRSTWPIGTGVVRGTIGSTASSGGGDGKSNAGPAHRSTAAGLGRTPGVAAGERAQTIFSYTPSAGLSVTEWAYPDMIRRPQSDMYRTPVGTLGGGSADGCIAARLLVGEWTAINNPRSRHHLARRPPTAGDQPLGCGSPTRSPPWCFEERLRR